ncbi:MAG: aspartate aminotransferase family protein [Planctomycetes bacterium]|nr:aspartate aminotransferase family protein [Planctomycetota bacterium]
MNLRLAESTRILERNRGFIPGGVVSVNRAVEPGLVFVRGRGSRVWDADGQEYIDYHGAFAPFILGHNDPDVQAAVRRVLDDDATLMGSGTTLLEGRLAELICRHVPSVERVQLTTSGSEATYHALRIARAHTGRSALIIMQGGYNGWHDAVAANVMTPLSVLGPRVSPGEYPVLPISAGIPESTRADIHVVNFNDLESARWVAQRHPVSCVILEPILQNIGIVKPAEGYLPGLRKLCDEFGMLLVFDEVKTGFRHALGGYQSLCGVRPDLSVFGKAIANGYPIGAIGGRKDLMEYFIHPDPKKRVLIAGTYNAHPIPTAAAIATIEKLSADGGAVYRHIGRLGERTEAGLSSIFREAGRRAAIARQGSAFCVYFMDAPPRDWHDVAAAHDMELDVRYRRALIERGIYHFPLATKQGSISFAHTDRDIDETLEKTRDAVRTL